MSKTQKPRRWWSAAEAAAYVPVHVRTVIKWVNQAALPPDQRSYDGPPPPFRRFSRNDLRFPIDAFKTWVDTPSTPSE